MGNVICKPWRHQNLGCYSVLCSQRQQRMDQFTKRSFCSRLLFKNQPWLSQMTPLLGKFIYNCISCQCGLMWFLKIRTKFSDELFPQTFQWAVEGQQGSRKWSASWQELHLCFCDSVSPVYLFNTACYRWPANSLNHLVNYRTIVTI